MTAKWVGDAFDHSIYDIHILLSKIPLLEWEAEHDMLRFHASDVMATNLVTAPPILRVSEAIRLLQTSSHNGFPVVSDGAGPGDGKRLLGLILRGQLITLLRNRCWGHEDGEGGVNQAIVPTKVFLKMYPYRRPIDEFLDQMPDVEERNNLYLDVRPYMNSAPYTMPPDAALTRVFRTFRVLGLRHIVVVNSDGDPIGMITRKELTVHRMHELTHDFDVSYDGNYEEVDGSVGSEAAEDDPSLGLHQRRATTSGSSA